jgi:hypothetical protein
MIKVTIKKQDVITNAARSLESAVISNYIQIRGN